MSELKPIIEQSMTQYAGAVLQSRALVDARDGLKPSARQIFYSMLLHKLTSDNPYKKTANAVGMAMADFYIHGDASCEGVIIRAGQGFAMRYPLVDVKGNAGTLIESGNWAAMRYTESRLSKVSDVLFEDIGKDTIGEWRDSYDNSKQYPAVLPTKGFYNLVNGTQGIGVALASSIPQFNLKEVNEALKKLLLNPDSDFKEIYCRPDFATGAVLLNEAEVKDSLKRGTGAACKLRSVVEYDSKERCFIVTEIPYGVYTNTICGELEAIILDEDNNPGVDRFNDLTGKEPLIKIYLMKSANPDKVLKYLYKNTSLQSFYGINMTMLDEGRFPRVFGWKEALQAHIDHEKIVYRRGFEFDLKKIEARIHILDGLLICCAKIEEVIQTIKSSTSTSAASTALQAKFLLDEVQAKAVLDMKLARLASLEVKKLENEREQLQKEADRINEILNDKRLFNQQLINGWDEVSKKFGDARRTQVLNISTVEDEPVEIRQLQFSLTNHNNVYASESSSLYTQRRGGVGNKAKLEKGEIIIDSLCVNSNDTLLFFTQRGDYYHAAASSIPLGERVSLYTIFKLQDFEEIKAVAPVSKKNYIIFFTKNGLLKKSELSEYGLTRNVSSRAIQLDDGDEIVSIVFTTDEKVGMMSAQGNFLMVETKDIRPIGRVARGRIGMKLNEGDHVVSARIIKPEAKQIVSVSENGLCKRSKIEEFSVQSLNTKGAKLQKIVTGDEMADFLPINDAREVVVSATSSCIKISIDEVPQLSKGAQGVKALKLNGKDKVICLN